MSGLIALCVSCVAVGCAVAVPAPSSTSSLSGSTSRSPQPSGPQVDALEPFSNARIAHLSAPVPAKEITAGEAASGISMPWKFLGFADGNKVATVAYVGGDGDCTTPAGFYVHPDGNDVTVEAASREAAGRTACADSLRMGRAVLQLPISIGGTVRLAHAAIDPPWSSPNFFR
ncbi:hypothetical protein [Arthrobacter sp. MMS18-M83]|uniref:hypothetical protein n=1 Tax=Arthrobacter sp. MMS18-M83 TaxID=2996261 RepID=UPI00227B6CE6|nr:hypothetical protein [Arthrobacter sp. MMS18-M83]WAH95240.1 hypothetical protein OW521_12265 [Arthrobacter sp. MMS18-M83]